jgi:hypothetical protein
LVPNTIPSHYQNLDTSYRQNIRFPQHFIAKISEYRISRSQKTRLSNIIPRSIRISNTISLKYPTFYLQNIRLSNIIPQKYHNIKHHIFKISQFRISYSKNSQHFTFRISAYQHRTARLSEYRTRHHRNIIPPYCTAVVAAPLACIVLTVGTLTPWCSVHFGQANLLRQEVQPNLLPGWETHRFQDSNISASLALIILSLHLPTELCAMPWLYTLTESTPLPALASEHTICWLYLNVFIQIANKLGNLKKKFVFTAHAGGWKPDVHKCTGKLSLCLIELHDPKTFGEMTCTRWYP